MFSFKYIIIDGVEPVLFTHAIEHITEAAGRRVTSAGFARLHATGEGTIYVECFGRSESLNIDSDPKKDALIIRAVATAML